MYRTIVHSLQPALQNFQPLIGNIKCKAPGAGSSCPSTRQSRLHSSLSSSIASSPLFAQRRSGIMSVLAASHSCQDQYLPPSELHCLDPLCPLWPLPREKIKNNKGSLHGACFSLCLCLCLCLCFSVCVSLINK